jgi:hypothetical protein
VGASEAVAAPLPLPLPLSLPLIVMVPLLSTAVEYRRCSPVSWGEIKNVCRFIADSRGDCGRSWEPAKELRREFLLLDRPMSRFWLDCFLSTASLLCHSSKKASSPSVDSCVIGLSLPLPFPPTPPLRAEGSADEEEVVEIEPRLDAVL